MRKINFFIAVSFSVLIASCSSPSVNVEDLKNQIRSEIESEKEQEKPNTPTQKVVTLPESEPTPAPYELPDRTSNLALDALDEFFALGSKTKSGITKANYSEAVSEARVIYDKFIRSEDSGKHPSKDDMTDAMKDYEYAKDVWNCYLTSKESSNNFLEGTCEIYAKRINSEYGVSYEQIGSRQLMYLPKALSAIWGYAAKSIEEADLKKSNPANTSASSEPEPPSAIEKTNVTEEKSAESNSVEVWGVIKSARGNVLPNATVVIQSLDDSHPYKKKFTADGSGKYTASDLPKSIAVKIFAQKPEGDFQTCYMLQTNEINTGASGARVDFTLPALYCS